MAMPRAFLATLLLGGAAVAGCYTGASVDPNQPPVNAKAVETTTPTAEGDANLPCDVAKLVTEKCASCHGPTLTGGAPNRLVAYDDLVAPSLSDPDESTAQLSLARMKDPRRPMPPDAPLSDDEIGIIQAWIDQGMPKGTCTDVKAPVDEYATPTTCTSGTKWTRGDRGSELMHPGQACIACHSKEREGPSYTLAGTLYPSAHEPDDCNGSRGGATVIVTDATGKEFKLVPNAAGNFYQRAGIKMPYTARVVIGDTTRTMKTKQTDGDCNGCHTEKGTKDAPGRIFWPAQPQ